MHIVSENAPDDLFGAALEALGATNAPSIIGQDGDARLGAASTLLTLAELWLTKLLLQQSRVLGADGAIDGFALERLVDGIGVKASVSLLPGSRSEP